MFLENFCFPGFLISWLWSMQFRCWGRVRDHVMCQPFDTVLVISHIVLRFSDIFLFSLGGMYGVDLAISWMKDA